MYTILYQNIEGNTRKNHKNRAKTFRLKKGTENNECPMKSKEKSEKKRVGETHTHTQN